MFAIQQSVIEKKLINAVSRRSPTMAINVSKSGTLVNPHVRSIRVQAPDACGGINTGSHEGGYNFKSESLAWSRNISFTENA